MPDISKLIVRCAVVMALAVALAAALESPANAFPLRQFVTQSELATHCNDAGGKSSSEGSIYKCSAPSGNYVICDAKTEICHGYVALTSNGGVHNRMAASIPCDPFLCEIFCGGRPKCTFGSLTMPAIRPKPTDTGPSGSLSSFSGGATYIDP
jgi:hypothetical protein